MLKNERLRWWPVPAAQVINCGQAATDAKQPVAKSGFMRFKGLIRRESEKLRSLHEAIEFEISFVELDPRFFRSGYIKKEMLRKIGRAEWPPGSATMIFSQNFNAAARLICY